MQSAWSRRPLRATRISVAVRDLAPSANSAASRTLLVHSTFRSALNVDRAGRLITIAADGVGGLPNGILVADRDGLLDFRDCGLRAGMSVAMTARAISVGEAGFVVDLTAAQPWEPRLSPTKGSIWAVRSPIAWRLSAMHADRGGLGSIAAAGPHLAALASAIGRLDRPAAAHAARGLIGLGPGLTPSGDDGLAGVEAALHAMGHPLAGFLASALDDVDERTTRVSATLLEHAARGEFAERIQRLLGALLDGLLASLADEIDRAVRWGATSGSDTLHGVLLGLDAAATGTRRAEPRGAETRAVA